MHHPNTFILGCEFVLLEDNEAVGHDVLKCGAMFVV